MFKRRYLFLEATPGAAGGGAPAAAASAPPAGAAPAAPATPGAGAAPAPTALAGAGAPATPPAATPGPNDWIPEKFRVVKEDGAFDLEASARKVEEHRSNLEKRMGSGDIPPKSADDYKVNVPEALAATVNAEELAKDPMLKSFLADAHTAGFTQKQVDTVLAQYLERLPQIGGAMAQMSADDCTAALKQVWTSDADYTKNVQDAYKAAKAYGGDDFEAILSKYGNDPQVVKLLAGVGKELKEDTAAPSDARGNPAVQTMQAEIDSLSGWLVNPKNHNSPEFKAKNSRYYELNKAVHGDQVRRAGSITINTV